MGPRKGLGSLRLVLLEVVMLRRQVVVGRGTMGSRHNDLLLLASGRVVSGDYSVGLRGRAVQTSPKAVSDILLPLVLRQSHFMLPEIKRTGG